MREIAWMWGRSSLAPSEQLKPTEIGRAWATAFQNASGVWPERVRPEASVMVPDTMIGRRTPFSSKVRKMA